MPDVPDNFSSEWQSMIEAYQTWTADTLESEIEFLKVSTAFASSIEALLKMPSRELESHLDESRKRVAAYRKRLEARLAAQSENLELTRNMENS